VQTPPIRVTSLDAVNATAIGSPTAGVIGMPTMPRVGCHWRRRLRRKCSANVASMHRSNHPARGSATTHVQPVFDIFAATRTVTWAAWRPTSIAS